MDTSIPFFVYGTLIPGQPNDSYWGESVLKTEPAVYGHGRLVSLNAFPMLLEDIDSETGIVGVLVYVSAADYADVMSTIDQLEEYDPENGDSPYQRVLREVKTEAAEVKTAWLYLGKPEIGNQYPTIESGDWVLYLRSIQSDGMTQWWREKGESLLFGRSLD